MEEIPETCNSIILGDAYKVVKDLKDKSVDLIVIDPPYEMSKSAGSNNYISKALGKVTGELEVDGLTAGIDISILDDLMRIMRKPNIYIWCNKKQIISYLDYFVVKNKCSFEILTWIKTNPIPAYGKNYLIDKEYCLYFRKGIALHTTYESAKTYWITPTNVKDKRKYQHPTIKPLEIIETLINNSSSPGQVVLDCFLGSGTTVVAAKKLGRRYIGIEYNSKYYEVAKKRISEVI